MRSAKGDEAAFPHPGVSGGMTLRQHAALEFAKAIVRKEGPGMKDWNARTMKTAFDLADAFLAAQENNP